MSPEGDKGGSFIAGKSWSFLHGPDADPGPGAGLWGHPGPAQPLRAHSHGSGQADREFCAWISLGAPLSHDCSDVWCGMCWHRNSPGSALTPSHSPRAPQQGPAPRPPTAPWGALCTGSQQVLGRAGAAVESLPGTTTSLGCHGRILILASLACPWLRSLCQAHLRALLVPLGPR